MVRIKERYLLVNILYPPDPAQPTATSVPGSVVQHQPTVEKLTPGALIKAIRVQVALLFGDYGSGALNSHLSVKYLSLATSTFILRCARSHYQMLWAALFLMDRVPAKDGRPCIVRVVRVSGTMRKVEEEAIRQARQLILAARQEASSAQAPALAAHQDMRVSLGPDYTDIISDDDAMDDAMDQDGG